ncbi:hypothetical protein WR25_14959 [Diploscapter pachys]|uniref:AMP deaminase n=1 Tax=Diploscapter pachys TaxID=2018661 RepID=A0A2A2LS77_9BILA|nr:hypothetical protein WR25_14959 [Diploscapter pachys]
MPTETKETKETNGVEFFTANSDDEETAASSPPTTNRPTRIIRMSPACFVHMLLSVLQMPDSNKFSFKSAQKEKRCKSKESVKLTDEAACLSGVRSTFNPIRESRHPIHHIKSQTQLTTREDSPSPPPRKHYDDRLDDLSEREVGKPTTGKKISQKHVYAASDTKHVSDQLREKLALKTTLGTAVADNPPEVFSRPQPSTPQQSTKRGIGFISLTSCLFKVKMYIIDYYIFLQTERIKSEFESTNLPDHSTANPFEIATTPIEVMESKKQKTQEIINRARLESQNDSGCLSPRSKQLDELMEPRSKSPHQVEMHTFRDAVDVNYQRMAITGEELSGVPLEDLRTAATHLIEALKLRNEYMQRIGHQFPATTRHFLEGYYPDNLPKFRFKNTESSINTSFNPPLPPKDHWGLDQPLPTFAQKFQLKRRNGVVEVCDEDGKLMENLSSFYISKEKFLQDTETITQMIIDGPLKSFCYRRLSFLQNKFQLHVLLNELRELHEQKGVSHRDFYNIRKVDTHIHAASSMNQKHLLRFIKKKIKTEANTVVMVKDKQNITMKDVFKGMGIDAYDLSVDMLDVHADRNTFHRFDKFNSKYNPVGESTLREIFIKTDNHVDGKYFAEVLKEVLSDLEESKYQHSEPRLSIYGRDKNEWDKLAGWALRHDVCDIYKSKDMLKNFDNLLDNIFTPLFEVTNDPSSHPDLYRFLQQVSGIDSVDDESKNEFINFDRSTPAPPQYCDAENPPYSYYLFYMYSNLCALNAFRRSRGMNTFTLRPHCGEAGSVSHLLTGFLTSESIAHGILLRKGLNVSLSTDDPLQFHYTKEALRTNVPDIRVSFRHEALVDELTNMFGHHH